jgi:hypothetical protein
MVDNNSGLYEGSIISTFAMPSFNHPLSPFHDLSERLARQDVLLGAGLPAC